MIRRVVLVKLDPDYATDRATVAEHTREVLTGVPGVRALEVGVPADERTRREWDLGIVVSPEAMEVLAAGSWPLVRWPLAAGALAPAAAGGEW